MGDLRKLFLLTVGLGIGLWGQFAGAPSQFVDNLIAPLRELFGPDASTTGKLFGLGLAALAAVAIIDRIRRASSRGSLFQQRTPPAGETPAIQPARIARVIGQQSAKEPPSDSDNAYLMLQKTIDFAVAQVEHEAEMVQGRGKEPVSVRLVPQVPIRRESAGGWFGGGARLPAGLRWPEIDGTPLQLLAQVDCTALPAGLWDGLGPRHGWLTIFIEPIKFEVQVMHFAEVGPLTPGPVLPPDCSFVSTDMRLKPGEVALIHAIPHWPVDVVPVFDGKDDPRREGWHKGTHKRYEERHDIATPALMPFDWPTARTMMGIVIAGVARAIPTAGAPHLEPEALEKSRSRWPRPRRAARPPTS